MDFIQYPLPIIKLINRLDSWSLKQEVGFERLNIKMGYKWNTNNSKHFSFHYYLKEAKSSDKERVFAFGLGGNPGNNINFDSSINYTSQLIRYPYEIDVDKLFQSRLVKEFCCWRERVKGFEETTLFGSPQLKTLEGEFINGTKLVEQDADKAPFEPTRQKQLLELIEHTIVALKQANSQTYSIPQIEEATILAEKIKVEIPHSTKNEVTRMLARLYAKIKPIAYQMSVEVIKFFTIEGVKAIFKL